MDCNKCIERGNIGKVGYLCWIYQPELKENGLKYSTPDGAYKDVAYKDDDITRIIFNASKVMSTKKYLFLMRYFNYNGVYGLCKKSFPVYPSVVRLFNLIELCCGGESGTDLINLPDEGAILDQDNRFIQAYKIYAREINEHREQMLKDASTDAKKIVR